ncbi:zinc-binding dehydrogenase [Jatrophihabitans sp.]|uniref:zinc-binding dehydrogenase n=1 Tax=Jatrophihabitans sp. TaxID=1932789 RepID=UPI0030C68D7E
MVDIEATALNRGELLASWPEGTTLGWDFAGTVRTAAEDGSGPPAGTQVFGWTPSTGTWAERALVPTTTLARLPAGLSPVAASAIGVAGVTALYALRRGGSLLGRTVIVTGAAGGVGRIAVQLAVRAGAAVHAIVGAGPGRIDAITSLELEGVTVAHSLEPKGERAHLILESVGGDSLSAACRRVAHGGVIVTYGRSSQKPGSVPPDWFYRDARIEGLQFKRDALRDDRSPSALETLASLAARGQLDPGVGLADDWLNLPAAAKRVLDREVPGRAVLRVHGGC